MQPEILQFLLDSSAHLRSSAEGEQPVDERPVDFQAVDRMLPDPDWFESGDESHTGRTVAAELFGPQGIQFEP